MNYSTCPTTPLLSHYTFGLQWGIIVYVCIPYHLHIPPSHSLLLSHLQVLTCGHGQRTTSHITPHHCYHTTRLCYNGLSLYISLFLFLLFQIYLYRVIAFSNTTVLPCCPVTQFHLIWYTMPPTYSTFTLPPLISSPGSHLWPRSTYYITYHTTPLLSHYTFGLSLYMSV